MSARTGGRVDLNRRNAIFHAMATTLLILALFYKWFALDDRYAVFLYNHMHAQPFDDVTVGRYWMTGLVAGGVIMLLYIAVSFSLARFVDNYRAPAWWRVWLWCTAPIAIGITVITMTQNSPTMPASITVEIVIVALIGLALALTPGALAAHRPRELVWLAAYGVGLVPPLLLLRAVELPARGLSVSEFAAHAFAIGGVLTGIVWLSVLSAARAWGRDPAPGVGQIFVAGLCWSYLVLPLAHYIFATPSDFKYITTSDNFFAYAPEIQIAAWIVAGILAVGAAKLGNKIKFGGSK